MNTRDLRIGSDPAHDAGAEPAWRVLSRGRSYTYVLPCREMDCLKVGFTRDPLARLRALHARYYDFFDLDRGALVEVEQVGDARALESRLKRALADHRASEPLVVRSRAGGKREWFRGASAQAIDLLQESAVREGFRLHVPLSTWVRERFIERRDILFGWSQQTLEWIEFARCNAEAGADRKAVRALADVLDACTAVGIELADVVPEAVARWQRESRSSRLPLGG